MEEFPILRAALCGLLAMFTGLGVARFGYAPLVPALVHDGWFSAAQAFWLGTVNLAGYFIGAAGMRVWRRGINARAAIILLMALTTVSLLASALNFGWLWFGLWRFLSGITGGALMVLMAAAVVGRAPPAQRGRVSGITFSGMGAGILSSALLIPLLLREGLVFTWGVLGLFCAAATLAVVVMMPQSHLAPPPRHAASGPPPRPVVLLIVAYALSALGFVPHMLFSASFVALGLHRGVAAGAAMAAWLGVAAMLGPPVLGRVADRLGFLPTLVAGYVLLGFGVALPLFADSPAALALSAVCTGTVALGSVMLVAGAIAGLVPPARLAGDWGMATMIYAVAQALVAAGFSQVFRATGSYLLLFGIGTAAMAACLLLAIAAMRYATASRAG